MNVHLGPAAALVLTALGLVLAGCRPVTVSLTENSGRGQAVIQSYYIAEQSKSWAPGSGAADDQAEPIPQWYGQTQRWFQAPDRWRIETSGSAASGSNWSTISVSDVGADSVSINKAAAEVPSADAVGAGSLAQLFERMAACYRPTVTGSGEIAGQPVHVVDVAAAAVKGAMGQAAPGVYELGGPDADTLRGLMGRMLPVIQRRRAVVNLPFLVAKVMAFGFDAVQAVTLGLIENKVLTGDQVKTLRHDNVVSSDAKGFADLGIEPTSMEAVLPEYLWTYRPSGQFAAIKDSAKNLKKA